MIQVHEDYLQFRGIYIITLVVVDVYYVDVYYVDIYYVDVYYVDVYYGLDPINRFNSTTFLCLSQARTWISSNICILCSLLCSVSSVKMRGDCSFS